MGKKWWFVVKLIIAIICIVAMIFLKMEERNSIYLKLLRMFYLCALVPDHLLEWAVPCLFRNNVVRIIFQLIFTFVFISLPITRLIYDHYIRPNLK